MMPAGDAGAALFMAAITGLLAALNIAISKSGEAGYDWILLRTLTRENDPAIFRNTLIVRWVVVAAFALITLVLTIGALRALG